jgi:hypothetical protein
VEGDHALLRWLRHYGFSVQPQVATTALSGLRDDDVAVLIGNRRCLTVRLGIKDPPYHRYLCFIVVLKEKTGAAEVYALPDFHRKSRLRPHVAQFTAALMRRLVTLVQLGHRFVQLTADFIKAIEGRFGILINSGTLQDRQVVGICD